MITNEHFETWISALESGKYEQGREYLRELKEEFAFTTDEVPQNFRYCCLGVLCVVSGWDFNDHYTQIFKDIETAGEYLNYDIIDEKIQEKLAKMNDSGISFKEIAKYLREIKDTIVEDVS